MKRFGQLFSKLRISVIILAICVAALLVPNTVRADGIHMDCTNGKTFLGIPTWYDGMCGQDLEINDFITNLLANALRIVFGALGLVSFVFIIVSGFQMMLAQGNSQKTAAAQSTLIKAIGGLIIGLAANAIVTFIGKAIGLNI